MRIKAHKVERPGTITDAEVAVADGEEMQSRTVTAFVKAIDAHGISSMVCSLRMTPDEAINFGERLIAKALGVKEYRSSAADLQRIARVKQAIADRDCIHHAKWCAQDIATEDKCNCGHDELLEALRD